MRLPVLALALALSLAACGEEEAPAVDPAPAALEALRRAMTAGPGMDGAPFLAAVQHAGNELWPGTGPEDVVAPRTRKTHQELAVIAADVARDVAKDPTERKGWVERDPESVAIHDAYVAALAKDVPTYRAFVEGEGAALLRRRIDRLMAPPR